MLKDFIVLLNLKNDYPWAKSIIICTRRYGKYKIPKHLEGLIAKYYLVDSRKTKIQKIIKIVYPLKTT